MKKIFHKILNRFNYILIRKNEFALLVDKNNFILKNNNDYLLFILKNLKVNLDLIAFCIHKSQSQIRQDIFVLAKLNFKKNGFFVEFGATNGVNLSNTYLLEKHFDWKGILAEPAKIWHTDLKTNRNCNIETKCVWPKSADFLQFNEVKSPELSTIVNFNKTDNHSKEREQGIVYDVESISLNDLLSKYNAPSIIDYLSIDTEGSELSILASTNFSKYIFKIITCEHNFTENREKIYDLLTKNGYKRIFEEYSQFDDWYIHSESFK